MRHRHPYPSDVQHEEGLSSERSLDDLLAEVASLRQEIEAMRADGRPVTTDVAADEAAGHVDGRGPGGSRRQLFRVAAGTAAGLVAGSVASGGRRVAAADPNDVVKNVPNVVTDTTTLDGSFPGPTLSLFNDGVASNSAGLYASSHSGEPTVRADNDATDGLGGVGVAGNAPGGRDLLAVGSGRIAMNDHSYGNAEAYAAGEIHQDGGTVYAMVTPTVRREIVGPASAGALHPVTPTRVYDSRMAGGVAGRLEPGQARVVSVADGRDVVTGAVTVPGLVPDGATAIMYNLTVDQTVGPGYLQVTPGDETAVTASTINWTQSDTSLANSSMVGISADRRVRVYCAPSASTHFIIDVLGYYA